MSDFNKYEPYIEMIEFKDVNPIEAERIAEKCFHVQSWIIKDLAGVEYKEILLEDDVDNVKSELMLQVPSDQKNAEGRKAWVQTRPTRREAFEKFAKAKAQATYLRRLIKLFEGAQIHYSAKAKRG